MKKAIVTTSNNLVYDNRVHKITLTLIEQGFKVKKTGRNYPATEQKTNRPGEEKLFRLPVNKGPLFYFFLNVYTFIYLLSERFDLIWAVDMDTLPAAKTASLIKRKPIIFDGHEFFSESPELHERPLIKKIWYKLEQIFLPGCHQYYTVSPGLVKLYKEHFNIDFRLLRNLPLKSENPPQLKESNAQKIILYQGALNVGRGIAQTIEALKFLPEDYQFVIVGSGDCTEELKELTEHLNLAHRVKFIGPVPFEKLPKYHKHALVGICTYEDMGLNHYFSLPNRLFDYMQAGIPVLTSSFPDMAQIVTENETGIVLDNLAPRNVADALTQACEDQELRNKWKKTIPIAAEKFTWENEKKVMNDVIYLKK